MDSWIHFLHLAVAQKHVPTSHLDIPWQVEPTTKTCVTPGQVVLGLRPVHCVRERKTKSRWFPIASVGPVKLAGLLRGAFDQRCAPGRHARYGQRSELPTRFGVSLWIPVTYVYIYIYSPMDPGFTAIWSDKSTFSNAPNQGPWGWVPYIYIYICRDLDAQTTHEKGNGPHKFKA